MTAVDLFSGIGGLTLGAWEAARRSRLEISVELAVELDPDFSKCYTDNFRGIAKQVFGGSVLDQAAIAYLPKRTDIILAGPPCQGHSNLNNRTRRRDERNKLYEVVADYAALLDPSVILIENVQGVVHDEKDVVAVTSSRLKSLGYQVQSTQLNALNFGLPQSRKRHVLVATKLAIPNIFESGQRADTKSSLRHFIEDIEDEWRNCSTAFRTPAGMSATNILRAQYLTEHNILDLPNELRPSCHRDKKHTYKSMYGRLSWEKPAQTITSGFGSMGQGRYLHPRQCRTITPHEAARIQGLPDFLDFDKVRSRTKLSEALANAVPPQLTATVLEKLIYLGCFNE